MRTIFETVRCDRRNSYRVEVAYEPESKYGESKAPGGMIDDRRISHEACPECGGKGEKEISVGPLPIAVDMTVECEECLGTGYKLIELDAG